jgi:type II secretory pathway predicted ATPase ExeA
MYESFFGLSRKPFNATPDPAFLYTNHCYQEAYATLLYGIQERKGFIALTGEVGTGKTTLLRRLMDGMNPAVKVVLVYNTTVSFDELVEFICGELEIPVAGLSRVGRLQALNGFLIAEATRGGTVILLLDEAQNLSSEALENLRLISNLETATDKLLQIVLVGQPELEAKLTDPALRQVTQRIAIRFRLVPLDDAEVEPYIDYRLRVVGRSRKELFSAKAIRRLIPHVKGIPRLINVVCDNALVLAYATDRTRVNSAMIDSVVADLRLQAPAPRPAAIVGEAPKRLRRRSAETFWGREDPVGAGRRGGALSLASGTALALLSVAAGAALALLTVTVVQVGGAPEVGRRLASLEALTSRALAWSRLPPAATGPAPAPEPERAAPAAPGETAPERPPIAAGTAATVDAMPLARPSVSAGARTAEPAAAPVTEPTAAPSDDRALRGPGPTTIAGRTLTIPAGGTISKIASEHYGRYSSLALDLIQELNPDIEDLDVVAAGQPLRLPPLTLSTLLRRHSDGSYRLILSSQPTRLAATKVAQAAGQHGYAAVVTTREIASNQVLYRVEIISLKTRAAVSRAWDTATRLGWFDLDRDPTERRPPTRRTDLSWQR